MAGQYDEAITNLRRSPTMAFWVQAYLAASYALTDRIDHAKRHVADVMRLSPHFSVTRFVRKEGKQSADRERLIDGLRKAGLPE
jgi:adenylate cyclase